MESILKNVWLRTEWGWGWVKATTADTCNCGQHQLQHQKDQVQLPCVMAKYNFTPPWGETIFHNVATAIYVVCLQILAERAQDLSETGL